jgi:hypothetical protein
MQLGRKRKEKRWRGNVGGKQQNGQQKLRNRRYKRITIVKLLPKKSNEEKLNKEQKTAVC